MFIFTLTKFDNLWIVIKCGMVMHSKLVNNAFQLHDPVADESQERSDL